MNRTVNIGKRRRRRKIKRGVVAEGLQQRKRGALRREAAYLISSAHKHVLVGNSPGRIVMQRVDVVIAADKMAHSLVTEKPLLVVPGRVAVVYIYRLVALFAQDGRQGPEGLISRGVGHEKLKAGEVRDAAECGKKPLVGMGAL